jgi:hypothetical protein
MGWRGRARGAAEATLVFTSMANGVSKSNNLTPAARFMGSTPLSGRETRRYLANFLETGSCCW